MSDERVEYLRGRRFAGENGILKELDGLQLPTVEHIKVLTHWMVLEVDINTYHGESSKNVRVELEYTNEIIRVVANLAGTPHAYEPFQFDEGEFCKECVERKDHILHAEEARPPTEHGYRSWSPEERAEYDAMYDR